MKQISKRLTYANVMSSIAVFLVLGGATAFAAQKIGSNEIQGNSITTGKIKKEAVSRAKIKKAAIDSSKLADEAVTTAKIAKDAVTGEKANESTFAQVPSAANAEKLGGVSATSYQQKEGMLFATVAPANGSPEIVRGRGATSVTSLGTGYFGVTFNRAIDGCTWIATYGSPNASGIEGFYASVKGGASPNEVRVVIWDAAGNQVNGLGFHLAVLCP